APCGSRHPRFDGDLLVRPGPRERTNAQPHRALGHGRSHRLPDAHRRPSRVRPRGGRLHRRHARLQRLRSRRSRPVPRRTRDGRRPSPPHPGAGAGPAAPRREGPRQPGPQPDPHPPEHPPRPLQVSRSHPAERPRARRPRPLQEPASGERRADPARAGRLPGSPRSLRDAGPHHGLRHRALPVRELVRAGRPRRRRSDRRAAPGHGRGIGPLAADGPLRRRPRPDRHARGSGRVRPRRRPRLPHPGSRATAPV
ncbi:MAG: hypothetical protein AVDCRST_MAG38-129, partial [uncultured Solirubrobacteraceae bacterium]